MARLILSLRGRELDKFILGKGTVVIGRSPDCDITIDNAAISRNHAQIEYKDDGYVVTDLGSSNGTFLNSNQISGPEVVKPGDTITVAKFNLTFQEAPQAEVQKMMGDVNDMEATMVVDADKMAQVMVAPGGGPAPATSGPRKLVVLKGKASTSELVIERDVITMGKAENCDLVIPGFLVGKIEATINQRKNGYFIVPMNGPLKLNAQKITKENALNVGDTFSIGKALIAFT